MENKRTILIVDDDDDTRRFYKVKLKKEGYLTLEASGAKAGLEIIDEKENEIDIILLDRNMPEMNGIEMVHKLKENNTLKNIPVVMQTGASSEDEINEGIAAGVFYYLTKPVRMETLLSVLRSAERSVTDQQKLSGEIKKYQKSFELCVYNKAHLTKYDDVENLASFLACFFLDPENAVQGIFELLLNAVEHGNLGLNYQKKGELIAQNKVYEEIIKREGLPENKDKFVEIVFEKKPDGRYIQITDQGEGFDWKKYMEIDPSRALDNHGRGIAMSAQVNFDKIIYNEKGNQVTGIVYNESDDYWS